MWSLLDMIWSLRQGDKQIWGCIVSPIQCNFAALFPGSIFQTTKPSFGRWSIQNNEATSVGIWSLGMRLKLLCVWCVYKLVYNKLHHGQHTHINVYFVSLLMVE